MQLTHYLQEINQTEASSRLFLELLFKNKPELWQRIPPNREKPLQTHAVSSTQETEE